MRRNPQARGLKGCRMTMTLTRGGVGEPWHMFLFGSAAACCFDLSLKRKGRTGSVRIFLYQPSTPKDCFVDSQNVIRCRLTASDHVSFCQTNWRTEAALRSAAERARPSCGAAPSSGASAALGPATTSMRPVATVGGTWVDGEENP